MKIDRNMRILAIDDSPRIDSYSLIFGIVYRNGLVEGALSTKIEYDGNDSTEKIIKMIKESRFSSQIRIILLNSITMGGLNIVDISRLSDSLSIPVIALTRHEPRVSELERAVKNLDAPEREKNVKLEAIKKAGEPFKIKTKPILFAQAAGIDRFKAGELIKEIGIEPLRLSHIVCSAIVLGESKGRF
ncbi:MAG: DUF99 family protein [Candidatus Micrarchaeota archaeon]|nr:DUF99 family protein [Candidatus Micrarchaeota archaeon]